MEITVLRKKLNTFKTSKGTLSRISDDVIMESLKAWEAWPGTSKEFYQELKISKQQLANIIKKAKRLINQGYIVESDFQELKIEETANCNTNSGCVIELDWDNGKIIRFGDVNLLLDFLKKTA